MKSLITAAMLLIGTSIFGQVNLEMSINNQGGRFGGGYVYESTGITLQAVHNFPVVRYDKPNTTLVMVGYEHLMGDNFNATVLAGAAFNAYTSMGKDDGFKNSTRVAGSIELGWDKHMGRLFIYSSYTKSWYFGLGMKVRFI